MVQPKRAKSNVPGLERQRKLNDVLAKLRIKNIWPGTFIRWLSLSKNRKRQMKGIRFWADIEKKIRADTYSKDDRLKVTEKLLGRNLKVLKNLEELLDPFPNLSTYDMADLFAHTPTQEIAKQIVSSLRFKYYTAPLVRFEAARVVGNPRYRGSKIDELPGAKKVIEDVTRDTADKIMDTVAEASAQWALREGIKLNTRDYEELVAATKNFINSKNRDEEANASKTINNILDGAEFGDVMQYYYFVMFTEKRFAKAV